MDEELNEELRKKREEQAKEFFNRVDEILEDKKPKQKGRPDREKVIGADDILNLKIALNTCETIEELIGVL